MAATAQQDPKPKATVTSYADYPARQAAVNAQVKVAGISRSEFIRQAIDEKLARLNNGNGAR